MKGSKSSPSPTDAAVSARCARGREIDRGEAPWPPAPEGLEVSLEASVFDASLLSYECPAGTYAGPADRLSGVVLDVPCRRSTGLRLALRTPDADVRRRFGWRKTRTARLVR